MDRPRRSPASTFPGRVPSCNWLRDISQDVAIGDLDRDGDPDHVIGNKDDNCLLFNNRRAEFEIAPIGASDKTSPSRVLAQRQWDRKLETEFGDGGDGGHGPSFTHGDAESAEGSEVGSGLDSVVETRALEPMPPRTRPGHRPGRHRLDQRSAWLRVEARSVPPSSFPSP